jgi:hypothetical protein
MVTKKIMVKKNDLSTRKTIYNSDNVCIYEDLEDVYTFDIDTSLYTMDILEAVSFLIKNKKNNNEKFWNLEIKENMIHYINTANSLYWLSGGNNFWNECDLKWVEIFDLYENKFQTTLYEIFETSETLKDIRDKLMKKFNLDVFYEFVLLIKLKKEEI